MIRTILVDDEIWALTGLQELIDWESFGFQIIGAFTDPHDAMEQILMQKPDVVFTDIRMPGLNGIELIRQLQSMDLQMEFVIISSYRDFEAAQRAIHYRVFQYILKPFNKNEVEQLVLSLRKHITDKYNLVIFNPQIPESFTSEKVVSLLSNAARYSNCFIIVSDDIEYTLRLPGAMIRMMNVYECNRAMLVSVPEQNDYFQTIRNIPGGKVGISRLYKDFSNARTMLQEALDSMYGNFTYSQNWLVSDIQFYLNRSITSKISLSEIASNFHLAETYLCNIFKKHTGQTLVEFIHHVRLHQAKRLIELSSESIKTISEELGFQDYNYFGRLFKHKFGISPIDYRNKLAAD